MLQRPTDASAQLEPPETRTYEFLLVPSPRRTRSSAGAGPLWAVAAPTPYGWRDEDAWREYPFMRQAEATFAFGATMTLRSVCVGSLTALRGFDADDWGAAETASAAAESRRDLYGEGRMGEKDGVPFLAFYVDDLARTRRTLRGAARRRGVLRMQVTERPEERGLPDGSQGVKVHIEPLPFTGLRDASKRAHHRLRRELQALALRLAAGREDDLPPLLKPQDWQHSEVHEAARELTLQLGEVAYRRGWTAERLAQRVGEALEFLLRARAGGLGAPRSRNRDNPETLAATRTVLVADGLPEELVAQGKDPVRDPRTSLAYAVALPTRVGNGMLGDEPADERLREVPSLVSEYLDMPWLRYEPLTATFVRALVAKELTLFADHTLRRPAGVLDGSLGGFATESLAYRLSDRGRRTMVLALVRFVQVGVKRLASTAALLAVLLFVDVPQAGWIAVTWLFFARRIRTLLVGEPEPSQLEKGLKLVQQMHETLVALTGRAVPVAVYRHALLTASEKGVTWDTAAWRLLADAERRGETVWRVSPGPLFE